MDGSNSQAGPDQASAALRQLPAVDTLLQTAEAVELADSYGRELAVEAIRAAVGERRATLREGRPADVSGEAILTWARRWLADLAAPSLVPAINATGVIIHTNLGRAPLSAAALEAVQATAAGYANLEYDLATGERGSRHVHAEPLLARLTGAEAALAVNNNAAAVLLMLTGLCRGRKVIISRGQLIEIGGGFRVPDVMAQSGAELVEVGTTNRTRAEDYAGAIDDETAAILVAHHSNFKIVGFTEEPSLSELARLAHDRGLLLLYDQGSGALLDTAAFGLAHEPTVLEGLRAGADLVAFSGDKLLGGPQAGLLCGRADLVSALKRHPLARAVRADKLALAALGATLRHYLLDEAVREVPVWQLIGRPAADLATQAEAWAQVLREAGLDAEVAAGESTVGGGSLPGATLPTHTVTVGGADVTGLAAALREHEPAVIGRIAGGRLALDPRTVLPGQETTLLAAVTACHRAAEGKE